jgi:hypothetical protein|tara:strand:+ start:2747 stop:3694 length:948 start_codon:yes stop_codon:yes gene_type:complete
MLGITYYHQTIRKYVAVFGTLFNDINIVRKNSSGVITEQIKVPIAYEAKDKLLLHIRKMSTTDASVMTTLPRMGFVMNGISYDSTRKLNTIGQVVSANTAAGTSTLMRQYNPVPYNFNFSLTAAVENAEDGAQIFEQIVPFFTPEFNVNVNLIPEMNISPDISIILNDVSVEDSYEGEFSLKREIIWSLNFMLKGYIYPDIKTGSVVKKVIVNLRLPSEEAEEPEYIILEDSTTFSTNYILLNADAGSPTATGTMKVLNEWSSESSGAAGIKTRYTVVPGPGDATANDDFGYTETTEFFNDNIDNDPVTGLDVIL